MAKQRWSLVRWSQTEQKQVGSELDVGQMGEYLPSGIIQLKMYKLHKIYLTSKGFDCPRIPLSHCQHLHIICRNRVEIQRIN